ncbi:MAG: glycosyltransferase family 2 protein [Cyanobacteria bacterium P01_D01_bin.56]
MNIPIVFIIFNRPEVTQRTFAMLRTAQPRHLFVIADAPRKNRPDEVRKCAETRRIIDEVDWECQVVKNYAEVNLGCARRISSGLDWVFEQCEQAIILEDDCLPEATFFPFCEELLERYKDDVRVMSISGQNSQMGRSRTSYSYYFSRYSHCWGWATWRRAWQHFDFDMALLNEAYANNLLEDILGDSAAVKRWTTILNKVISGEIDSWAYRWSFACWMHSGLSIISDSNLISNIGFGDESTSTKNKRSKLSMNQTALIEFPLRHPPYVVRNSAADNFVQKRVYERPWHRRLKGSIKKMGQIS